MKLKQTGHTPGPWKAIKYHDEKQWHIATEEYFQSQSGEGPIGRIQIADTYSCGCNNEDYDTEKANARIIAAAPELLVAAKMALRGIIQEDEKDLKNALPLLRAAIAKAIEEEKP